MRTADTIVFLSRRMDVSFSVAEFFSIGKCYRIDDEMIMKMCLINMRGNHHLIITPQPARKFQSDLMYLFCRYIFIRMKGLFCMVVLPAIRLTILAFYRIHFFCRSFREAVYCRNIPNFIPCCRFFFICCIFDNFCKR